MTTLIPKLVQGDAYLKPFTHSIRMRMERALLKAFDFTQNRQSLSECFNNHLYFGLHKDKQGWVLREWAPSATALYLIGDTNQWQMDSTYAFKALGQGLWELRLPDQALSHGQLYKLHIQWLGGSGLRLPSHVRRVVQDPQTKLFAAQVWEPKPYCWQNQRPNKISNPLIYEAHIGMSSEESHVSNFGYFTQEILPYIAQIGYNTVQLMAVQEHPYYGSFGYQVSNFYAVSSRFGTPEELKALVDRAHELGLSVIMDVVHSHAVRNEEEGLNRFDGSDNQYFHSGSRGDHPAWDSKCFDYGNDQVLSFLLSNLKYWLDEYRFDGFRFDGVTSMIYHDHGLGKSFSGYEAYFDANVDEDAIVYLTLANRLIHEHCSEAVTIAEDVSGLPGLAVNIEDGGVGFDFRMSMGVADMWIRWIKEIPDQQWPMGEMFHHLSDKRADEKTVSYAECHDQAMVGDKTIMFRLMDSLMYTHMSVFTEHMLVSRAMALHKMIRLVTLWTAGDAYLTFMGNEFGHPEWIDFPREGNDWSCFYARRQWSLLKDSSLRYQYLANFDRAMLSVATSESILSHRPELVLQNDEDQVLAIRRGSTLAVFNFSPERSYESYGIDVPEGIYERCLDSDLKCFDGFQRNEGNTCVSRSYGGPVQLKLYLPARSAQVFRKSLESPETTRTT